MRVLVVTTWYPSPASPNTGIFVRRDVETIARDHDVAVLHLAPSRTAPGRFDEGGIPVERLPVSWTNPADFVRARAAVVRGLEDRDLLHTAAISSLIPLSRRSVRKPWVHTEHWSALVAPRTAPRAARAALPFVSRRLAAPDVVVAVSEYLAATIRRRRTGPVVVVPNHVMAPATAPTRRAPDGTLRLVAVGSLTARKNPLLAIETVVELRARGVDARLTWIGDGPLRDEVMARVRASILEDAVAFRGEADPAEVSRSLAESDIFLLPTTSETFGVAIAEALAHGLPVVTGAEGGQSEFVSPSDGVLVREPTPGAYADGIIEVWSGASETRAQEIADCARARFSDKERRLRYAAAYDLARTLQGART